MTPGPYGRFGKRLVDLVVSIGGLAVLSPFLTLVGLAIRRDSRGPVFFTQERIGRQGRPFQMVKFRTMLTLEDSIGPDGELLENYDRVTRIGRVLRETSLDELPQLINVAKGEMSLIGPRPTLAYQVERYTPEQRQRLELRPGLSGLAQVNGRNNLSWDEKIAWDISYVRSVSLWGDVKIVLRTVTTLLRREGVAFQGHDALSDHGSADYRAHI
ncbi:sugar transferase [Helicobacter pylori]